MNNTKPVFMGNMFEISIIVPDTEAVSIFDEIKGILQDRFPGDQLTMYSWLQRYYKRVSKKGAVSTNKHKMMVGLCLNSLLVDQIHEYGDVLSDVQRHLLFAGVDIDILESANDMGKTARKLDL